MVTGTIRIPSIAKFVQQNFDSSEALAKHLTPVKFTERDSLYLTPAILCFRTRPQKKKKMSLKPNQRPSFFKILIVDFTRRLRVPPVFSQRYGSALGGSVRLRNSSGKIWFVKLEQMDEDERYCFTQGWNKFAEEVGLEVGEFLVFRFVGESMFDVSVYGVHGCDREIPGAGFQVEDFDPDEQVELREDVPNVIKKKQSRAGNARTSESDHSQEEKSPLYFEILLKFHHRSRVSPPKKFWMAAGLSVRRTVGVVYLPKHHYQIVKLDHRPKYRIDITSGWSEFRKANGLVFGKTYSFEFKPSRNVIEVQELKT